MRGPKRCGMGSLVECHPWPVFWGDCGYSAISIQGEWSAQCSVVSWATNMVGQNGGQHRDDHGSSYNTQYNVGTLLVNNVFRKKHSHEHANTCMLLQSYVLLLYLLSASVFTSAAMKLSPTATFCVALLLLLHYINRPLIYCSLFLSYCNSGPYGANRHGILPLKRCAVEQVDRG